MIHWELSGSYSLFLERVTPDLVEIEMVCSTRYELQFPLSQSQYDASCLPLISSDSAIERNKLHTVWCEQTNLIWSVSKLENLLTKLISQFSSPLTPLSSLVSVFPGVGRRNIFDGGTAVFLSLLAEEDKTVLISHWELGMFNLVSHGVSIILYPTSASFVTVHQQRNEKSH